MTQPTSRKLAKALDEMAKNYAGVGEDGIAKELVVLAARALNDEFHDFLSPHVCGVTYLYRLLSNMGVHSLALRVANGEFDASWQESQDWADSEEGKAAMAALTEHNESDEALPMSKFFEELENDGRAEGCAGTVAEDGEEQNDGQEEQ